MRWLGLLTFFVASLALAGGVLRLATTTSVYDSGLLDVILPPFEQKSGFRVQVIAVGTGQALAIAGRGDADAVLVHAPALEARFLKEGLGRHHRCIAKNHFLIVGPAADPAGVREAPDAVGAFRRIYEAGALFVSRGDGSGTHLKELTLWRAAKLEPQGKPWYLESGSGMGATLTLADEKRAYTLTDLGTYLYMRGKVRLRPLFDRDDPWMLNQYGYIEVNPNRFPWVQAEGARALGDYLLSPEVQARIGDYLKERYGRSLFVPLYGRCAIPVEP